MGRRKHTPSGVATSWVYGILPFGLRHSGASLCQNRITGDPRTASGRYNLGPSPPNHLRESSAPAGKSSACLRMWSLLHPSPSVVHGRFRAIPVRRRASSACRPRVARVSSSGSGM
ncbi:hypothetical protein C3492_16580 [Streptomyces sp. Ru62]|nr:hypothetical protein C3492_16580 [Streptomyces sp. Ru62]